MRKKLLPMLAFLFLSSCLLGQTNEIEKLMTQYSKFEMINGAVLISQGDKIIYKNAVGNANIAVEMKSNGK